MLLAGWMCLQAPEGTGGAGSGRRPAGRRALADLALIPRDAPRPPDDTDPEVPPGTQAAAAPTWYDLLGTRSYPASGSQPGREAPVPGCYTPPSCVSWSAHSRWRSTNFCVLPVDVFGSDPNSTESGHL